MTEKKQGVVQIVAPNKKGYIQYKIDDEWYGTWVKEAQADRGDTIEFEYKHSGNFRNIVNNEIKVISKGTGAPQQSSSSGGGSVDWDLKDRKIQWQSARNAAIELVHVLALNGAIPYKTNAKAADKQEVIEAFVDQYTNQFYEDSVTLGDEDTPEETADESAGKGEE